MMRTLVSEFEKLKRSRMVMWTSLVVIGYTSIGLAMFPIIEKAQNADGSLAGGMGEVFAQAGIVEINWSTAMKFIPMGVSGAWGVLLLSLVAAYVFGRELREGTDVSTATLPVRREAVVLAKMVVIAVWTVGLSLLAVLADIGVLALYLGFDGFALSYVLRAFGETVYACLPIFLTLPLIGWLSRSRKGYMRPMLFALAAFMVSSSLMGTDAAAYVPWSMPIVAVGVTWMPLRGELTAVSWAIALVVFILGMVALFHQANRVELSA
jgi:ABC-type transport system involved in multi-copper enzyme maturation permease subunit